MSNETIELLKILKDETQSRSVFDRCEAEIASLRWTEPSPNAKAWNTTVAERFVIEALFYGTGFRRINADAAVDHIPCADVYTIRDGEEVRVK